MSEVAVAALDELAARRLTAQIRLLADSVRQQVEKIATLVAQAREGQAHAALGYPSWTAYVASEFAGLGLALDRDDRRELVVSLSRQGMSSRAIAPVVGVSHETVTQDVKAGVRDLTPALVTGLDGKTYARPVAAEPEAYDEALDGDGFPEIGDDDPDDQPEDDVIEAEIVDEPTPEPKRNRRPITDAFRDATYDVEKAAARVQRLTEDDRFPRNAEQLARHRYELLRAADAIAVAIDRLPTA